MTPELTLSDAGGDTPAPLFDAIDALSRGEIGVLSDSYVIADAASRRAAAAVARVNGTPLPLNGDVQHVPASVATEQPNSIHHGIEHVLPGVGALCARLGAHATLPIRASILRLCGETAGWYLDTDAIAVVLTGGVRFQGWPAPPPVPATPLGKQVAVAAIDTALLGGIPPRLDTTLNPGDVIALPRYGPLATEAATCTMLVFHLSRPNWADVVLSLLRAAETRSALADPVAPGSLAPTSQMAFSSEVKERVESALASLGESEFFATLDSLVTPVAVDIASTASLRVSENTRLTAADSWPRWRTRKDDRSLVWRRGHVELRPGPRFATALERLAAGEVVTVSDLSSTAPMSERLAVGNTLVSFGIARVVR